MEETHMRRVAASAQSLQEGADILRIDQGTLWRKRRPDGILMASTVLVQKQRHSVSGAATAWRPARPHPSYRAGCNLNLGQPPLLRAARGAEGHLSSLTERNAALPGFRPQVHSPGTEASFGWSLMPARAAPSRSNCLAVCCLPVCGRIALVDRGKDAGRGCSRQLNAGSSFPRLLPITRAIN